MIEEYKYYIVGWSIVSEINNELIKDYHNHRYIEKVIYKASWEYMIKYPCIRDRIITEEHDENKIIGNVISLFPLTSVVKKIYEIKSIENGILMFAQINNEEIFEKIESKILNGISVEGEKENDKENNEFINSMHIHKISLVKEPANKYCKIRYKKKTCKKSINNPIDLDFRILGVSSINDYYDYRDY